MYWDGTSLRSTAASTRMSAISGGSLGRLRMAEIASREFVELATFMRRRRNRGRGEKTFCNDFPMVLAHASGRCPGPRVPFCACRIRTTIADPVGSPRSFALLAGWRNLLLLRQPLSYEAAE